MKHFMITEYNLMSIKEQIEDVVLWFESVEDCRIINQTKDRIVIEAHISTGRFALFTFKGIPLSNNQNTFELIIW